MKNIRFKDVKIGETFKDGDRRLEKKTTTTAVEIRSDPIPGKRFEYEPAEIVHLEE